MIKSLQISKELVEILSSYQFSLYNEKLLQEEIATALSENSIEFTREKRLDSKNIVDFMVGDIAVEIKIKGSKRDIFKQCQRYCEFDDVKRLILVTNKAIGLPEAINKKPCHILNLGQSWL